MCSGDRFKCSIKTFAALAYAVEFYGVTCIKPVEIKHTLMYCNSGITMYRHKVEVCFCKRPRLLFTGDLAEFLKNKITTLPKSERKI